MNARTETIDAAYAFCVAHDHWPEGFNPFDAIRDLLREVRCYDRAVMAHHEISTLSEEAIRESIGGPCLICRRANGGLQASE